MRKGVIITIWLSRDINNHGLISMIDVDSQTDEQSGRAFFFDPSKITKRWICIYYVAGL
jgi:hypothetical protein